jgi:hypothetical protein
MNVRSTLRYQIILIAAFLFSCSDDEGEDKNTYSFKDQDLSGEIGGEAWTYEDGFVDEDTYDSEEIWDFRLFLEQEESACDVLFAEGDQILFFVPRVIGLYELSLNSSFEGRVVNLIEDEDVPVNNLASNGAIEILTVTETEITGRIDARLDRDNYVNGNFTVSFCTEPE